MLVQCPSAPPVRVPRQAWQVPVLQALSQQTLLTQVLPLTHCEVAVHA